MAASGSVFFWNDEKEGKLVELWEHFTCLYQTTSDDYKDRAKKNQAYVSIADVLGTTGRLTFVILHYFWNWTEVMIAK